VEVNLGLMEPLMATVSTERQEASERGEESTLSREHEGGSELKKWTREASTTWRTWILPPYVDRMGNRVCTLLPFHLDAAFPYLRYLYDSPGCLKRNIGSTRFAYKIEAEWISRIDCGAQTKIGEEVNQSGAGEEFLHPRICASVPRRSSPQVCAHHHVEDCDVCVLRDAVSKADWCPASV
jgi:hypothetical protein